MGQRSLGHECDEEEGSAEGGVLREKLDVMHEKI